MTRLLLALTCVCVLSLAMSNASAQAVVTHSNKSTLHQIKDFELRGDARSGFRQFKRKAEYFGSLYVNRPERIVGAYENANSVRLADEYARAACRAQSRKPEYCILYARVLPKNFTPQVAVETLSRSASKEFREYSKLQNKGRFGAFAVSDNGAVGYSWAEPSPKDAEAQALKRCAKSARKVMRTTSETLQPIVASPARQGCRLIHRGG